MSTQPTDAQQGAADGFFLLLPQRPKPEAPMSPANRLVAYSAATRLRDLGFEWDATAEAWLQPAQPAPATQQAGERVYAFRRKGLDDFCTCGEARYEELSNKPHLFETRIFYTAPQPVEREPLSAAQKQHIHNETGAGHALICLVESYLLDANGIKGGQHGTE